MNNDKIGIIFKNVSYNIDDIKIVWYVDNEINWKLYSDKDDSPYSTSMSQEKAQQYIDYINNYKYDKLIKF